MYSYFFKGTLYESASDLSAETGLSARTALWHMQKHGHLRHLEERYDAAGATSFLNKEKPLEIEGVQFSSLRDLSRKTGVPEETVRRWHTTTGRIKNAVNKYKEGQKDVE